MDSSETKNSSTTETPSSRAPEAALSDPAPDPAPDPVKETHNETETTLQHSEKQKEIGGRDGPDPTRYGDWENKGRCVDF